MRTSRGTAFHRFATIAGALLASAIMVLAGSIPASASSPHPAVRGYIDIVAATTRGHIHVAGWSVDPYRSRASNSEDVTVDGVMAALPTADKARPDVARALHITGRHGFDVTVAAKAGLRRVCVVSRPVPSTGGQDVLLGCRSVRVQ